VAAAGAAEGDVVSIDYSFPKPGTKRPATKQSLEMRIGNQTCGVSYSVVVLLIKNIQRKVVLQCCANVIAVLPHHRQVS
jgi:hypothetical protein